MKHETQILCSAVACNNDLCCQLIQRESDVNMIYGVFRQQLIMFPAIDVTINPLKSNVHYVYHQVQH